MLNYLIKMRRTFPKKLVIFGVFLTFFGVDFAFAQTPKTPPMPPRTPRSNAKIIRNDSDTPAEKSIAVDAKVNISLCVNDGKLKVNGWERNEVRAFVSDGSQVGFRVLQKGRQNDNPVWIMVVGFDPMINKEVKPDECLSGDLIELDVPRNATVNVKSNESETTIDSVGKVSVENVSGDIFLNGITRGIEAKTYEGDVIVKKSSGAMMLLSTTGNIVAFDVGADEIGDVFKAKTSNGAIMLKNVGQRQIEVGSNSGSINFNGEFLNGGQYIFGTSNGSITLNIPQNSSSKINASYGFGAFSSEIPLQNVIKNSPSRIQNLSAQIGAGDATLKLSTVSGAILIKKQ